MDYVTLGNSGLQVSRVGLGCNNFGGRIDLDATRNVIGYGGSVSSVMAGVAREMRSTGLASLTESYAISIA